MKDGSLILIIIVGILAFCLFIWGMYWITKTFSYWFFYEDMVRETVREMIDKRYLIGV